MNCIGFYSILFSPDWKLELYSIKRCAWRFQTKNHWYDRIRFNFHVTATNLIYAKRLHASCRVAGWNDTDYRRLPGGPRGKGGSRPPHGVPDADAAQNLIVLSSRALAHPGVITTSANLLIVSLGAVYLDTKSGPRPPTLHSSWAVSRVRQV